MYVGSSAILVSLSNFKDGFAVTGLHLICGFQLHFDGIYLVKCIPISINQNEHFSNAADEDWVSRVDHENRR